MNLLDKKRLQVLEALQRFLDVLQETEVCDLPALSIGQVMTQAPSCMPPGTSVLELAKLLHRNEYRHQLITDESGRLLGVISDRDVLRCFGPGKHPQEDILEKITAGDIMSTDLVTVGPECSIDKGLALLLEFGIGCLPVVTEGQLVGIVTNTDLQLVLQLLLQTVRVSRSSRSASPAG